MNEDSDCDEENPGYENITYNSIFCDDSDDF